ncbi:hypothetical protein P8918_13435 [Bacillus spizizenii]|nr:hypothetical protein [Bacillus spizizenii]MCY8890571.1 hypothetical protein [Bacillus spizizenii]MEC0842030.1 hypothetical protein [Bacillus spizizenii]
MDKPRISWFVKDSEGSFMAKEEHHAGTYTKQDKIAVDIQVWNNRWGVEDVEPLVDPVLNFYFDTLEDSSLLHLCKIIIDDMGSVPLVIKGERASARIGRTLSGKKNNGDDNLVSNQACYINVRFEFEAEDYRLKENDLKNIYFELVSMT